MHGIMQIPQNNNIRKHEKPILPLPSIVNFVLVMAAERRKTAAIAGASTTRQRRMEADQ